MEKQVTVLMSTYNGERYLQQQIDSILQQCGVKVRLIVRDDGSTDQTLAILKEYQDKGQLQFYTGPNLKTARSFLHLLQNSPISDYYAFSDQDDVWDKDKLVRAISLLVDRAGGQPVPLLYAGSFRMTDRDLKVIDGGQNHFTTQKFANAIVYSNCTGCTMVMNKSLRDIIKSKPQPHHLLMHDDWIHKVCLAMGGKVIFDTQPKMSYRQHRDNVDGGIHPFSEKLQKVISDRRTQTRIMSSQLSDLLTLYGDELPAKNKELLKYALTLNKGNLFQRLQLAFDPTYTIRENRNLNHEFRISLLLNYW